MPLMTPLVVLKLKPGGRPLAVKPSGVFAPVTVKLNGWPRNATALNGLVIAVGALELPLPKLFVGYKLVVGNDLFRLAGAIPIQMRLGLRRRPEDIPV